VWNIFKYRKNIYNLNNKINYNNNLIKITIYYINDEFKKEFINNKMRNKLIF